MRRTREALMLIASLALICLFFYVTGIGCPIEFLTGISCMGCGMTRAYAALLRGDIAGAFMYHPLFILPVIWFFLFLFREKIAARAFKISGIATIVLFAAVYIVRMLDRSNTVVVFDPANGFIYRSIVRIYGFLAGRL